MKKQRNLSYHISILAFLFVISTVMVTSSPFQMLLDVNPSFKSTFSFKLANAADDGGGDGGSSDDDDGGSSDFNEGSSGGSTEDTASFFGESPEDSSTEGGDEGFDQTSFEELGGGDESPDVDQEAQTET